MRLAARFRRLSLWSKLGVVGALAAIIAIPLSLRFCRSSPVPVTVDADPNVAPNLNVTVGRNGKSGDAKPRVGESLLAFTDVKSIPQPVNRKSVIGDAGGQQRPMSRVETATFRFSVASRASTAVTIARAELLVDQSRSQSYSFSTAAHYTLIDHSEHVRVVIDKCAACDAIPIPLRMVVYPKSHGEFTVWFTAPNAAKRAEVLYISGRLRLHYGQSLLTSQPVDLEIHSDNER
jgi:hypothetical protein